MRVEEYAVPELRDRRLARDAEKLGDAVEIDHSGLVQRDREAALATSGVTGGWSTRSVKIGPCFAMPVSAS